MVLTGWLTIQLAYYVEKKNTLHCNFASSHFSVWLSGIFRWIIICQFVRAGFFFIVVIYIANTKKWLSKQKRSSWIDFNHLLNVLYSIIYFMYESWIARTHYWVENKNSCRKLFKLFSTIANIEVHFNGMNESSIKMEMLSKCIPKIATCFFFLRTKGLISRSASWFSVTIISESTLQFVPNNTFCP